MTAMSAPSARLNETKGINVAEPHAKCSEGHICQEPSGRVCCEPGCDEQAGTWWGPYWCPEHDKERLYRISRSFESMMAELTGHAEWCHTVTGCIEPSHCTCDYAAPGCEFMVLTRPDGSE